MEQLRLNHKLTEAKAYVFPCRRFFFSLQEYRNEDANQDYIIKSITHSFKNEKYENSFAAIPIDHHVRPIKKTRYRELLEHILPLLLVPQEGDLD